LSAIVEIKTTVDEVPQVLSTVHAVAKRIDTVISVGVSTRCDENGNDTMLAPLLADRDYTLVRAKTNMGLGRVTNVQPAGEV
jgi:hypothetical protein